MKVLITPTSFGQCGPEPLRLLQTQGYEVVLNETKRKMTSREVIDLARGVSGIIAGVETYDKGTLKILKSVKCISRCGTGMDSIDLEAAKELNIAVKNTPWGPTRAVAELTIAVMLDVLRGVGYCDRQIRAGNWKKFMGHLLLDKTVGIIGYGKIGRLVAELVTAFGAHVIVFDPAVTPGDGKIKTVLFDELLRSADIVCLHVSVSKDNGPLLDEQQIRTMKKGAVLINMSRGGVVKEDALCQAVKSGDLFGAATDVFEKEPYQGQLCELDNIVLTPHIGSYAKEARLQMEIDAVTNLIGVLENL